MKLFRNRDQPTLAERACGVPELNQPALTNRVFEEAKKRFRLLGHGGLDSNAFCIAPPLTVTKADVEEALDILRESLEAAGAN